jgi:AraC-like DNA-binding protein
MENDQTVYGPSTQSFRSTLPVMRLITAEPIVAELDKRGLPTDQILDGVGLTREAVFDPETFVQAMVMYQFLEDAARVAGDRQFAASVGEGLDLTEWFPMIGVAKNALTVGDVFTGWAVTAAGHSNATEQRLDVHGAMAIVSGHRSFKLTLLPAQLDGFQVGFLVKVLRHAMGSDWNPQEVLVTVCDPKVLPVVFHGIRAIKGDSQGHQIRFPALWLTRPFDETDFLRRAVQEAEDPKIERSIAGLTRQAIRTRIGDSNLTGRKIASICGLKYRVLTHMLTIEGTNLTTITNELKRDLAVESLVNSDQSISDIAAELGYADPTSFARAFKKWTGKSPARYRRMEW